MSRPRSETFGGNSRVQQGFEERPSAVVLLYFDLFWIKLNQKSLPKNCFLALGYALFKASQVSSNIKRIVAYYRVDSKVRGSEKIAH